jgi:CubicO group peptidase (beta-lactamase class C family)
MTMDRVHQRIIRTLIVLAGVLLLAGCGGGSSPGQDSSGPAWSKVTAAINDAQAEFPNGLAVEIATPDGVVYSHSWGGFTNATRVMVASASKWVTATVLLRLVDQGVLILDEKMSDVMVDRYSVPWSGPMGNITLRDLLSQTSGIHGDDLGVVTPSDSPLITLEEAVYRIYGEQHNATSTLEPGTYFWYGSTHFRIAARYAEVKTNKKWERIFEEQLRDPLEWSTDSTYTALSAYNPNPAATLTTTGQEYMRFMVMQLKMGLYGTTRLLPVDLINEQRRDGFQADTVIEYSPYAQYGYNFHYGLGNWRECDAPDSTGACSDGLRISSTGTFGWAPWIDENNDYAAVIMTRQPVQGTVMPSENLKVALAGLIPEALAQNPPVIRAVP